ncbi:MAG TPA: hypothetical protein VG013_01230 [Gemmataceae bacterium]|nr:hypothetical protein [Gemmataceae bacterium]
MAPVSCPSCGRLLSMGGSRAGDRVRCPCGLSSVIPALTRVTGVPARRWGMAGTVLGGLLGGLLGGTLGLIVGWVILAAYGYSQGAIDLLHHLADTVSLSGPAGALVGAAGGLWGGAVGGGTGRVRAGGTGGAIVGLVGGVLVGLFMGMGLHGEAGPVLPVLAGALCGLIGGQTGGAVAAFILRPWFPSRLRR